MSAIPREKSSGDLSDLEGSSNAGKSSASRRTSGQMKDRFSENKLGQEVAKQYGKGEFIRIKSIDDVYKMGKDVVPVEPRLDKNGNPLPPSRAARFGIRKSDMKRCVLKIRNKKRGFVNQREVDEWISMMCILYNISGGAEQTKLKEPKLTRICHVHDLYEDNENYYCSMEYCKGRDLFDYHAEECLYSSHKRSELVRAAIKEMLLSTQELHQYGMVHRDLKLENVVLDESDEVKSDPKAGTSNGSAGGRIKLKIIDFDTVEIWKPDAIIPHVMGTDQYIAPEVYAGVVTPAGDMWSIGVVMFVLWTGHFPYPSALFTDGPGENTVGHPQMEIVRNNLRGHKIDFNSSHWSRHRDAKDFVRRCFLCDPRKRLTVQQALEHPFILGAA